MRSKLRPNGAPELSFQPRRFDLGAMEQRLFSVESDIRDLATAVNGLASEIRARSSTQWGLILSALSFALLFTTTIGYLAYAPVKQKQEDHDRMFAMIADKIVPRSEHSERWRILERDLDKLDARVDVNFKSIVPRGEHEEKWRTYEIRHQDLEQKIASIRNELGGTYNLRDALKDLQARLDRIEMQKRNGNGN
jgi:hypothetical protein